MVRETDLLPGNHRITPVDAQDAHSRGVWALGGQGGQERWQVSGRTAAWQEKPIVGLGLERFIFPSVLCLFGTGRQNRGKAGSELAKGKVGPVGVAADSRGNPCRVDPKVLPPEE